MRSLVVVLDFTVELSHIHTNRHSAHYPPTADGLHLAWVYLAEVTPGSSYVSVVYRIVYTVVAPTI